MTDRNWGAIGSITVDQMLTWLERLKRAYKIGFAGIVGSAIILVMIGVALNQLGIGGGNFVLAAIFLITWAFFAFWPEWLLAAFGIGMPAGLPNMKIEDILKHFQLPDVQIKELFDKGLELVQKYARYSSHVAYFAIVVFTVFGSWNIQNPVAVLPMFIILAGVGFWAVLSKPAAKWYYRITIGILIVSLVKFLFIGYAPEKVAEAPVSSLKSASKTASKEVRGVFTDEWQVYRNVVCPVQWDAQQGWCEVELPPGTYRAVAKYQTILIGQESGYQHPVPPEGLSLLDNWGNNRAFVDEFHREAPLGHNNRLGSLVAQANGTVFDPRHQKKTTFEERGRFGFNINLPPKPAYYANIGGNVMVDIEKLVE